MTIIQRNAYIYTAIIHVSALMWHPPQASCSSASSTLKEFERAIREGFFNNNIIGNYLNSKVAYLNKLCGDKRQKGISTIIKALYSSSRISLIHSTQLCEMFSSQNCAIALHHSVVLIHALNLPLPLNLIWHNFLKGSKCTNIRYSQWIPLRMIKFRNLKEVYWGVSM